MEPDDGVVAKEDGHGSGAKATDDNKPSTRSLEAAPSQDEVYSIFTPGQKKAIVLTASFCSILSPLTGSIYYPALDTIARDYHVSNTAINLTVTTFLILQGIAPTFVAGFSDGAGRRPAYFICFTIYLAANIGLGLQQSYAALLVLRCVQSAGSSGTIALATGVAADVATASERGSYVSLASIGAWLSPILGPILGGLISQYLGWHWIFWILAILAGVALVPLALFFPETNRRVVGDGSFPPPPLCASLTSAMMAKALRKKGVVLDPERQRVLRNNYRLQFPNPLAALAMAADKSSFVILLGNGLVVGNMYAVPVGVSELFARNYGFDTVQLGLCFVPFGVAAILATFFGRVLDWNYRRHAARLGLPAAVRNRAHDLGDEFPIERARLEVGLPMIYLGVLFTVAYGWLIRANTHVAGPLVLSFFISLATTCAYLVMNTIMVDNYPDQAATAAAANNLFRCLIGAGATAAVGPMISAWGAGWTYTFFALLWVVYSPAFFALIKYGPRWRKERREKQEAKARAKEAATRASRTSERDRQ